MLQRLTQTIAVVLLLNTAAALAENSSGTNSEAPQRGGTLNVGTVSVTLSALSWDPADWTWKSNHDAGAIREQLFAGDLDKSVRKGGRYPFIAEAYLPQDAIRGELAEHWHWETPLTLVIELRKGVMFTALAGIMAARELTADDVVFTYDYQNASPKRIPTYFTHIERVEARDKHTVVFHFSEYNAEWAYRFGYGYYSGIIPREAGAVDLKNWRNTSGTGPFKLEKYIHGNSHTYSRNELYWDTEQLGDQRYPIPFVDRVKYRIIKDEATYLTAIRTGKIDLMEIIRWIAVDHLKESTPELKWNRWLATGGQFVALRVDRKPFDDIRVRRALNLAVNQQEIQELFYGGHAELMAYPQHPGFEGYFEPLDAMRPSVQELFEYNPAKAKQLLTEAGYPDGFDFKVQVCSCSANHMDLVPLLDDYFSAIGVNITIQPLEYASFLSVMTTRKHAAGYFMGSGHTNPTTTLRKSFGTGQTWNPSQFSDPEVDERIHDIHLTRDEGLRQQKVKALTEDMLDRAPYIWLPTPYYYTAWWPWVKNYNGELRAGAVRPGPIYARLWIDQEMKRSMGFK